MFNTYRRVVGNWRSGGVDALGIFRRDTSSSQLLYVFSMRLGGKAESRAIFRVFTIFALQKCMRIGRPWSMYIDNHMVSDIAESSYAAQNNTAISLYRFSGAT